MPNSASAKSNGYTNGHASQSTYEMEDQQMFLFTSESVGEGHPGNVQIWNTHTFFRFFFHISYGFDEANGH